MPHNLNYECAMRLATAGLFVFPLRAHDRHPLVAWSSESTTDTATVARWWQMYPQAVPALDLGKCGLTVFDGDRHAANVDGVAQLRQLLKQHAAPLLPTMPVVRTPRDGIHVYFAQPATILTNRRGRLPAGIDVRGAGGFVVAPGAEFADGRRYVSIAGQPDLALAFTAKTIPVVPAAIVALVDPPQRTRRHRTSSQPPTSRERAYALAALQRIAGELTRNTDLNKAAFVLGTMVARDWITRDAVEDALFAAMDLNGYIAEKGTKAAEATLASGLGAGLTSPHDDLPIEGVTFDDFVSHAPSRTYFFLPCREPWPGASVNTRLPKVAVTTAAGEHKEVSPTAWLDRHRSVEQQTWAPGEPMLIPDKLFLAAGGCVVRPGCTSLNHYRPPLIEPGNAAEAEPWLEHVAKIYPDDEAHIIRWLAHRVQRPAEKINHALLLGGAPGIGKDALLEPVRVAVGPWNVTEVSPVTLLGRFNGFLKSVILKVNEAHDMGEYSRFALYERMKLYTAAPPDVLRVDEKNLREYAIVNCCGVVLTTNHPTDSLFLPNDDRRFYVAWSNAEQTDFVANYWRRLWGWYNAGGIRHVAAYLAELDLSAFDPKAPPPKTPAFWTMVTTGQAPEDAEIADVLDELGNPNAVTLADLRAKAAPGLIEWLDDRRNRRIVPHRMSTCGYAPVRNLNTKDGLWRISGMRQVIYVKSSLPTADRLTAAMQREGRP